MKLNKEMKAKFIEDKFKNDIVHLRVVAGLSSEIGRKFDPDIAYTFLRIIK